MATTTTAQPIPEDLPPVEGETEAQRKAREEQNKRNADERKRVARETEAGDMPRDGGDEGESA